MAAPQITITLEGNGSVTLRAPQPDIDAPVTVPGVTNRTQGGSIVQYQVGPPYWEATITVPSMTNVEKDALETFFRNNWGASFTYVDENANTFAARFVDASLPLRKSARDQWTAAIRLNLSMVLK